MPSLHSLAEALNNTIAHDNGSLLPLLSERGRAIFFPKGGIVGQTAEAKGATINATIGIALEDDGSPMRLPSMARQISLEPKEVFPYASTFGVQALREQWQFMQRDKNPSLQSLTSLPVVCPALTGALTTAGFLFVDDGDVILSPDKYWGNYRLTFNHNFGSTINTFNSFCDGGFDLKSFSAALSEGTDKKIVLLNFPNNPSGYTPTVEEAREIVRILTAEAERSEGIVAIIDDAYFGLVYEDGIMRESLFASLATAHEKLLAVKIDGATKEDYVWGHRVGFITFASKGITEETAIALEAKAAGAVRGIFSNVCHLSQSLLLRTFRSDTYWQEKKERFATMQSRYRRVREVLCDPKYAQYFTPLPFNSGYFMCVELAEGLDAEAVRKKLLSDYDTGVISIGNLIRVAYSSLPEANIQKLFENLYSTCQSLSPSFHEPRTHAGQATL